MHKVATILGLQTARSHPSTAFPPQRIVLQSPGLEASAAAAGQGEGCPGEEHWGQMC